MLSRVADSMYWMSRYFERADHSSRVLEANYNLMLNPSKVSNEQRWQRIAACLGYRLDETAVDPQTAMAKMILDSGNRASIVCCITSARENASQVREQISSEMWERLNQLYHEVTQSGSRVQSDSEPLRLVTSIREGSYKFYGVTDQTMSHDEGWHFIQLGRFMERACAVSNLLDAHFATADTAEDLDWVGLLASCSAFEAFCKVYTADLQADRVAEFLLLNAGFPYSVRHAADRMHTALQVIAEISSVRKTGRIERIIGQLQSSLAYAEIDEIMSQSLHDYLSGVVEQCWDLHAAMHDIYIEYPIETAFEA